MKPQPTKYRNSLVRKALRRGFSQVETARMFNITEGRVWQIAHQYYSIDKAPGRKRSR